MYTWRYWSQGQYCTGHCKTDKKVMEMQRNKQQDTKAISVGAKGSLLTNYLAIQCHVLSVGFNVYSTYTSLYYNVLVISDASLDLASDHLLARPPGPMYWASLLLAMALPDCLLAGPWVTVPLSAMWVLRCWQGHPDFFCIYPCKYNNYPLYYGCKKWDYFVFMGIYHSL